MTQTTSEKTVAILLCTFNGSRFLNEQLESIKQQTHKQWKIYISDDGSSDETLDIVMSFKESTLPGQVQILHGPRKGFGKNFMSLIYNPNVSGDYYAFSDQDDIWHADKLERGLAALNNSPELIPALYCTRTHLINTIGESIGLSPLFRKAPSFQNAIIQSIAGANTMIINDPARKLLRNTEKSNKVVTHDWLAYIIISGCNGHVIYDPLPSIDYRQHEANLIGANSEIIDKLKRLGKMTSGRFRSWNDSNLENIENIIPILSRENKDTLLYFVKARNSGLPKRMLYFKKSKIYRQTLAGNASLIAAMILNKV
jgi:glycosyltransferase involved in cell wall biosynthesis